MIVMINGAYPVWYD